MKHRFRINGEVYELECQLGSGLYDTKMREIFEGDKIKFDGKAQGTVQHINGTFVIKVTTDSQGNPTIAYKGLHFGQSVEIMEAP